MILRAQIRYENISKFCKGVQHSSKAAPTLKAKVMPCGLRQQAETALKNRNPKYVLNEVAMSHVDCLGIIAATILKAQDLHLLLHVTAQKHPENLFEKIWSPWQWKNGSDAGPGLPDPYDTYFIKKQHAWKQWTGRVWHVCLGQDDERSGRYSAMTVKKASTRCVALRYSLLHCLCVLLLNVLPLSVASRSYSDNLRWTCKPVRWILRSLRPVRRCHGRHGPSSHGESPKIRVQGAKTTGTVAHDLGDFQRWTASTPEIEINKWTIDLWQRWT